MKEGKCDLEQPGVNAPGTPKMATFLSLHKSVNVTALGFPSGEDAVNSLSDTDGNVSTTFTSVTDDMANAKLRTKPAEVLRHGWKPFENVVARSSRAIKRVVVRNIMKIQDGQRNPKDSINKKKDNK